MFFQQPDPFIVTVVHPAEHQSTILDLLLGSLGLTVLAVVIGVLLGALLGFLLVRRNRRHRPEHNRLPPISPLVPDPTRPPSSPAR